MQLAMPSLVLRNKLLMLRIVELKAAREDPSAPRIAVVNDPLGDAQFDPRA